MSAASRNRLARLVVSAASLVLVVGAAGCGGGDEPAADDGDVMASRAAEFCTAFPERDAAVALTVPSDPSVAGDLTVAKTLMAWVADSAEQHGPDELHDAIGRYVDALRAFDGSSVPLDDPDVAEAVTTINVWLAQHCGPPSTGSGGSVPGR